MQLLALDSSGPSFVVTAQPWLQTSLRSLSFDIAKARINSLLFGTFAF